MKIGIVVPLKASVISKNWSVVEKNLKRTLDSINRQTSGNYQACVVGHDKPAFFENESYGAVRFVSYTETPPPINSVEGEDPILKYERDKFSKVVKGISFIREVDEGISHWYLLDADDLIHKDFIKFLQIEDGGDAYIFDNGYIFYESYNIINATDEYSAYSASSCILNDSLLGLDLNKISINDYVNSIYWKVSHVNMREYLESKEINLSKVNDRLVMYVRDNGENISSSSQDSSLYFKLKRYAKALFKRKKLSKEISSCFGI